VLIDLKFLIRISWSLSKSGHLASGYDLTWLKKNMSRKRKDDEPVIGGLTDEDAYDERPSFPAPANPQSSNLMKGKLRPKTPNNVRIFSHITVSVLD